MGEDERNRIMRNIYKGLFNNYGDEFDHKYACWANNHRGWAKMKKANKRLAKKRLRRMKGGNDD